MALTRLLIGLAWTLAITSVAQGSQELALQSLPLYVWFYCNRLHSAANSSPCRTVLGPPGPQLTMLTSNRLHSAAHSPLGAVYSTPLPRSAFLKTLVIQLVSLLPPSPHCCWSPLRLQLPPRHPHGRGPPPARQTHTSAPTETTWARSALGPACTFSTCSWTTRLVSYHPVSVAGPLDSPVTQPSSVV